MAGTLSTDLAATADRPPAAPDGSATDTAFDFSVPPFDRLTEVERTAVTDHAALACFVKGTCIVSADTPPAHLFVVHSGAVAEQDGFETVARFGPGDSFATRTLFGTPVDTRFVADETTVCHLLPHAAVLDLVRRNRGFGDVLIRRHAQRLIARSAALREREISAVGLARLRAAPAHPPLYLDADTSLHEAARQMRAEGVDVALVRQSGGIGVVTGPALRNAVLLDGHAATDPVGTLAVAPAVRLSPDHSVLDALARFGDHGVRHILVGADATSITGVLEQGDILRVLADRSDIIAGRIDHAAHPVALGKTVASLEAMIGVLQDADVDSRLIANLVTDLNRRVFRRLYEMLAPARLLDKSCLLVMGSEGRGEQILRTDQDNGLIVADDTHGPSLRKIAEEFTEHLVQLGYPPCPGHIMVSNPDWRLSVRDWHHRVRQWVHTPNEEALLNLAIFVDAAVVAGDATLLARVRGGLFEHLSANAAFFSHFARAALNFDDQPQSAGLLAILRGDRRQMIDVKKAGIFPIVHGVRTLALEHRLAATGTVRRLAALTEAGVLDRAFAEDLAESLHSLQRLRTKAQLARTGTAAATDSTLDLARLGGLDRAQFHECIQNARRLKDLLRTRYHLALFE